MFLFKKCILLLTVIILFHFRLLRRLGGKVSFVSKNIIPVSLDMKYKTFLHMLNVGAILNELGQNPACARNERGVRETLKNYMLNSFFQILNLSHMINNKFE